MIATLDRLANEQAFHDAQAAERAESFRRGAASLRFKDAEYLDHASWLRYAFTQLGNVRSRRVLDLGCGHGMASVVLARRGAIVTATDLSAGYVTETRLRAIANGVNVATHVGNAERLPFEDHSYDAIWGHAILHHLDVASAAKEMHRLLKPQGVAVLSEPWGGNPLLRLVRRWLPGKHRTRDERALEPRDIDLLKSAFGLVSLRGFQFFGLPFLTMYGRYVVVTLRKA